MQSSLKGSEKLVGGPSEHQSLQVVQGGLSYARDTGWGMFHQSH